jgi:hypothetical protein
MRSLREINVLKYLATLSSNQGFEREFFHKNGFRRCGHDQFIHELVLPLRFVWGKFEKVHVVGNDK